MASQAGVFYFDMRPASANRPALCRGLGPMALDGVDIFVDNGVAMAFGASHTWTGERHSRQPWRSPESRVITWDGRLDNRDDLLVQLHRQLDRDASDAAIALGVFERWGIEGLRHLVGEWSAAIWDGPERTLHLARDYMGVRPLYYCATETSVMWSTSLGDLAERSGRDEAISKAFVAGFMTLQFSGDLTPYAGIRSVPCAT
jgi:asparagine synthase (glutamine-hydrolysing)